MIVGYFDIICISYTILPQKDSRQAGMTVYGIYLPDEGHRGILSLRIPLHILCLPCFAMACLFRLYSISYAYPVKKRIPGANKNRKDSAALSGNTVLLALRDVRSPEVGKQRFP